MKQENNNNEDLPKPKLEESAYINKWWENEDLNEESAIKWKYLEHHGVTFPDFYSPHNVSPLYNSKKVSLNRYQEEMATYWAQTLGTDWEQKNDAYKKNFRENFLKTFDKNSEYKDFDKFDFMPIRQHLDAKHEEKKNRSKEVKQQEKLEKERRDKFYAGAIIDNTREKIAGYSIEPPTLFKGRGKHPKAGIMKARIMPEIVTINVSEDAPVPKCPMEGHNWGEIICN